MTKAEKRPPGAGPSPEPTGARQAGSGPTLRRRAEEIARERAARSPEDIKAQSPEDIRRTLHELRVHQIELEMQNDELRRGEEELEASRARYFDLYDLAPVGYLTVGEKGLILEANLRAADLLGVERKRLVKQPLPRYIVREDQDSYYLHRRHIIETGARQVFELRMRRQDGSPFWGRLEATVARDGEDGPPMFRIMVSDITELKKAEEEKRLLEDQIRQAHKLESLGVLAGGIAHDFNNLLMVVLGHAEMASREISPTSAAAGNLSEITAAAQRAAALSGQMLAYAGRAAFAVERVCMRELVEEMAPMLQAAISRDATLTLNLERGLPPIEADPGQIRQVAMNLVINASEAIGDRSGTITVSAGATHRDAKYLRGTELHDNVSPGPYVHLEVTDTGHGMDAETRARIFDPFYTTKFTGRGLGLAAVQGIVRGHKGALKVVSEPGRGTTFTILFPALTEGESATRSSKFSLRVQGRRVGAGRRVVDRPAPKEGEDAARPPLSSPPADRRGKGTILLVDDEVSLVDLGSQMLEHLGFTVLTAADGLQAVDLYRERSKEIDLVLLDLTMPNMDGARAFDELRRLNPDVRIVLASGYSLEDVAVRFEGKDLDGVLQKPYTLAKLEESVAGLLPEPPAGEG